MSKDSSNSEADCSPSSNVEVKNAWKLTSTAPPPLRLDNLLGNTNNRALHSTVDTSHVINVRWKCTRKRTSETKHLSHKGLTMAFFTAHFLVTEVKNEAIVVNDPLHGGHGLS